MDLDPAIAAAIDHAVKAGACWTALRVQPKRDVWRYLGAANSRRAGEALGRLGVERHAAGAEDEV